MKAKDKLIVNKIILAKYLYQKANAELTINTDLAASVSINLLLDSVEMVILALEEQEGLDDIEMVFNSRVDRLRKKLKPKEFPLERQIKEINKARRNFKHGAQLQNVKNIKSLFIYAIDFMTEATKEILGFDFNETSLSTLIKDEKTSKFIREAEKYYNNNKYFEAITSSVKAYYSMPSKGENKFAEDVFLKNAHKWSWTNSLEEYIDFNAANDISQSFSELYHFVSVVLSGTDIQKFKRFSSVTPSVSMNHEKKFFTNATYGTVNNEINSRENAQFCISFVIDEVLKSQEKQILTSY